MQKTRKSIAKKFKMTGGGKVLFHAPNHGHFMRNKSNKQLRNARKDRILSNAKQASVVRAAMPFC